MELNRNNAEGDDNDNMPLSLISKFCDSKLKELSEKPLSESDSTPTDRSSWFSTIFNGTSSYRPKRREHCSGSSVVSDAEPVINCSDFGELAAQQLNIKRKIPMSKHIRPNKIAELMTDGNHEHFTEYENGLIGYSFNTDVNSANICVKERLKSYLPALKRHVQNGPWAHLDALPSLECLTTNSVSTDSKVENGDSYFNNTYQCTYEWDSEQAFPIASTPELMVFYGIISKPNSIQLSRLRKLFAHVGVASLPLQNMSYTRKRLYLLDGTGRIELNDLSSKLAFKDVVSGVPVALIGKVKGTRLNIEDVVFATPCSPEWPFPREDGIEMVFVSGLYMGSEEASNLALDLLQDYLLGLAGSAQEQEEIIAPRARLFLVGNLISKSMNEKSSSLENVTSVCAKNMEKLDNFLEPLVRLMEVFLLPGENDMTFTSALPQPPIHPTLLPQSGAFPTLKRLTNPAKIQVSVSLSESNTPPKSQAYSDCSIMMDSSYAELLRGEVDFIDLVLQSGKNVKQTMEYCDVSCPLEMGQSLLKWAHLHPTCCDTSTVLEEKFPLKGSSPHVVVIGNLSEFKTTEYNGTKIIGIPSFRTSRTAVVLTKNFDVIPLSFRLL